MKVHKAVLVTGATGALGPRVVTALHNAGYRVRTLSLAPPPPGLLPTSVETILGDITDEDAVRAAMDGIEMVVHLAALLHIVNPSPERRPQYEHINVDGTRIIVDAARAAGIGRLVFFSTIAVYGQGGSKLLDEDAQPYPNTLYAETKLAAERIVLDAKRADGQPLGVVLRLGAVYGSRIKGNYQRLVRALAHGRFVPIGDGSNRRTLICDKDVARAALLAAQHPAAAGKVYNVTDGQFHTVGEINRAICAALGRKPPRFYIPTGPARLAAGLLEDAAHLLGRRSPVGRATIDKYTEDVAVDGQRIQRELGFQPAYDLYAGWQDAVDEMRRQGEL
ncbi:MAG: NAD-dependent epimerase/dehydratase family protein [Caldilineaceae bacterium]|nr:NAD-dependent epimerase/dehydratase family protein [Caldilineaceae bacterium]